MKTQKLLINNCLKQSFDLYGIKDELYINEVAKTWMDDSSDYIKRTRITPIKNILPNAKTILDMASGCGAAVFWGLKNGYDIYGIDPEEWKNIFIKMKINEEGYPKEWENHFYKGVGESLPFPDNYFDAIISWYTLEHVQNPTLCIQEMIRVTKSGGGIFIECPDYQRTTFEGHYKLPWLPILPKKLARIYLKILGKPTKGLDSLQYISKKRIIKELRLICRRYHSYKIKVVDLFYNNFLKRNHHLPHFFLPIKYYIRKKIRYFKVLFHEGSSVSLFIKVQKELKEKR